MNAQRTRVGLAGTRQQRVWAVLGSCPARHNLGSCWGHPEPRQERGHVTFVPGTVPLPLPVLAGAAPVAQTGPGAVAESQQAQNRAWG